MTPEKVLKKYWGHDHFRPLQRSIIDALLHKHDVLTLLPTGGGKSICYQIPGLLLPGLTIVISPLISLMKDQVDSLVSKNIPATYLASTLSKQELKTRIELTLLHKYKFLYLSPERLKSKKIQRLLSQLQVSLVVVDEAHCVSLWGGDFRPEYKQIPDSMKVFLQRPILAAFTATATAITKNDIIKSLALSSPLEFIASFARNIDIAVAQAKTYSDHELLLLTALKQTQQKSGIIYTTSRHATEWLSTRLNNLAELLNIGKVGYYHAGLPAKERQATQQLFLTNYLQVLVATTAFGMGIDKPDIGYVIHYHLPSNIESYYQEIGRAGRSGQQADALLLYAPQHLAIHQGLLDRIPDSSAQKTYLQKTLDVLKFIQTQHCRMQHLLKYFGEDSIPCNHCDNCCSVTACAATDTSINAAATAVDDEAPISEQLENILQWRTKIATQANLAPSFILSATQLRYLLLLQPTSLPQLQLIPGLGTGWISTWGESFLSQWYNTREEKVKSIKKIYEYSRPDPRIQNNLRLP